MPEEQEQEKGRKKRHEWDGKSLTHRLDLSGVATPSPRPNGKPRGKAKRPPTQKRVESGDKKTGHETKSQNCAQKENDMSDQTQTQTQNEADIASAVSKGMGDALKSFKGVNIKVDVETDDVLHQALSYGTKGLIIVGTAAAGTAAVLGVARLFGFKPRA
jgi:hypothetical protein